MCFIKCIIQTAASMISMDRRDERRNVVEAREFTALMLWHYTMQPGTFRVGNGIFLPDITFSNVTSCRDPAKKMISSMCHASGVSFRNFTAYPPHFTHIPASLARACRFAFVVCWSALWKLGQMQPEWLHHRRNSVKHLSLLFPLVPRKDLSAASTHIAHSVLLAAPPSITLLNSSLFACWLYPECTLGEILCFANLDLFLVLCGLMLFVQIASDANIFIIDIRLQLSLIIFTKYRSIILIYKWMFLQ